MQGAVDVTNAELGTNWARFNTSSDENSEIRVNIYQFPNWKTFVDGQEVANYVPEKELWGRMHIEVPAGDHEVYAKLYDTPIRMAGNIISLISWVLLGLILLKKRVRLG